MTLMVDPAPMTPSSGALLPLFAFPRHELLTGNEANSPLINDERGEGVHFKPLRLNLEAGVTIEGCAKVHENRVAALDRGDLIATSIWSAATETTQARRKQWK